MPTAAEQQHLGPQNHHSSSGFRVLSALTLWAQVRGTIRPGLIQPGTFPAKQNVSIMVLTPFIFKPPRVGLPDVQFAEDVDF